jgi:hypothetical protein
MKHFERLEAVKPNVAKGEDMVQVLAQLLNILMELWMKEMQQG